MTNKDFWYAARPPAAPAPSRYAGHAGSARAPVEPASSRQWIPTETEEKELVRRWAAGESPFVIGVAMGRRSQEVLECVRACLELAHSPAPILTNPSSTEDTRP